MSRQASRRNERTANAAGARPAVAIPWPSRTSEEPKRSREGGDSDATHATRDAPAVAGTDRDLRIDFFRGLALWFIFVDHIPTNIVNWLTVRNFGFSDATETFVFIAGYSAALVYSRVADRQGWFFASAKVGSRVWRLYIAHIVLFMFYSAQAAWIAARLNNPMYVEELNLSYLIDTPHIALIEALLLRFRPANLDVLPLYIVLLAVFPVVLWMLRVNRWLLLALSLALYAAAHAANLNLRTWPSGEGWYFNPFAWQLCFVLGAVCNSLADDFVNTFRWRRIVDVAAIVWLLFGAWVALSWRIAWLGNTLPLVVAEWLYPFIDKTNLGIGRLAHFLALAWLVVRLVPADAPFLRHRWAWPVVVCGRQSLQVFCFGIYLSFASYLVLAEVNGSVPMQILISAIGIGLMVALAMWLTWYGEAGRRRTSRAAGAGAAAAIGAAAVALAAAGTLLTPSHAWAQGTYGQPNPAPAAGGGAAAGAAANGECAIPDDQFNAEPMPAVANALAAGRTVTILALGSGSTIGAALGRDELSYPAQLKTLLAQRFPRSRIEMRIVAQRGFTAAQMLERLKTELPQVRPALVIWQTGSVDAMRGVSPEEFMRALDRGMSALRQRGVDALLMDMQYAPYGSVYANLQRYREVMQWIARRYDVTLFSRYDAMDYWANHGLFDPLAGDSRQQADGTVKIHHCLAASLARLIELAVHDEQGRIRTTDR